MSDGRLERTFTILNKRGLHARAAAKFAAMSNAFECDIEVERNGQSVAGRSIMGLMMLAASTGTEGWQTATTWLSPPRWWNMLMT